MIWRVVFVATCLMVICTTAFEYSQPSSALFGRVPDAAGNELSTAVQVQTKAVSYATAMDVFRLETKVLPVSYALEMDTNFDDFTYAGLVEILIRTVAPTCRVVVNSKELEVTAVEVFDHESNKLLSVLNHYPMEKNEQYVVIMNDTAADCLVPERLYVVKASFEASLRDDMSGYYKSSYRENNVTKWLAVTKFDPFHARQAFPCFDEPALKATFKISLKRRYDQISLSNMPLINSTKIKNTNMYWDHYQETPPVSTYLVGFFVGDYISIKSRNIGIYTHTNYLLQAEYLANESPKLLQEMESFTGIDYMMPKLDMLSIPNLSAGSMENWGLIAYREILSLLSENSKTKIKEYLTTMVQHGISHQWFGNLVTCAWWDYVWLNEGFATYFQYLATNEVEPDWRLEDVFVYEVHQLALQVDQTPRHPISASVKSILEIRAIFDDITYSKAGTVLRMLQYTVTKENFKSALNLYLEENKYKAVTPEQLWTAFEYTLQKAQFVLNDEISVTEFMKSWTEQAGYPVVKVKRLNTTFVVTQERFLVYGSNDTDSTEWIIGLTYTMENKTDFDSVLPKFWLKEKEIVLKNLTGDGWFIFNLQSIGFYRVNYEDENWNELIDQLHKNCSVIHVLNRAQIIDDLFNLAKVNFVDYNLVMRATQYLQNEVDVVPWYSVKKGFEYLLNRMWRYPDGYKYLKVYVKYLAGLIYGKIDNLVIKNNNTDHSIKTAWNAFSYWACILDDESCTKSALSYFNSWQQGKTIPADIKDAAFCVGIKNGNSDEWNTVLNLYVNSDSASDRHSAQMGLACSKDPIQLSKYLNFMFGKYESPIRPQDFQDIYQPLASTPEGVSALIDMLYTKLDRIVNEIIDGEQVALNIYSLVASTVVSDEDILKLDNLRKDFSVPAYLRERFNYSYQEVDANLAWFNINHLYITQLANTTINELGLSVETDNFNGTSTVSPPETSSHKPSSESSIDVIRLPNDVLPVSYTLEIATDFEDFTYSGHVEIVIQSNASTCQIVLNSKELQITSVDIIEQEFNTSLSVIDHYLVEKNEQFIIDLNETMKCLVPDQLYTVKIDFKASLRDDMSGYYRSSYKENGVTKWLAITKFEPFHTKKAFPCFDEPALKAPFKISIQRRSNQISLSNMPLLKSIKIEKTNMYWDHYQETPLLSTYLVGFFVGEFVAIKINNIAVYTHLSYIKQAEYLAAEAPKLLQEMEKFTGVDYMLPKLDMLAIPDISAGGINNWGLNAYREILSLLSDNSKTKIKEYLTTMIQHGISHQWFGNLVTCAWWDYVWLNEGFATYFQYLATNEVEPDWRLEDVFVYEVHQLALQVDQTPRHPISASVKSILEIRSIFDDISYSKAGTVLRMLQYTVTKENFKSALNFYLKENKYKAVTPKQLWTAFEYALQKAEFVFGDEISVTEFMKSWTEQAGYPLVKVKRLKTSFAVTQKRFLVYGSNITDTTKWIIGLTYTTEKENNFNNVTPKTWLKEKKEKKIILPNENESGWYIFNLQSIGFYRVNYEEDNWNALITQLQNDCTIIHVLNRAQIIDDLFNLAKVNEVDYTLVLNATKYLKKEVDVVPWYSAKKGFEYLLNRMWRSPDGYKYLQAYVKYLAGLIYNKLDYLVVNYNNNEHSVRTSWNSFSYWACFLDDESCIKNALSYFNIWRQGKIIPADIKDATFCAAVRTGNSEVWNSVLNVYVNSESASDRHSAQMGLACSRDPIQLSKYLNFMFKEYESPIRPQDFHDIYQSLASSPEGVSALVNLLTNKLDCILDEIIDGEQVAIYIYSLVASRVSYDEDIRKIDNLRKDVSKVPEYLRKIFNISYNEVEANMAWFNTYHFKITQLSKDTLQELGIDLKNNTVESSTTISPNTSTETTSQSSSSSIKTKSFVLLILIIFQFYCF